MVNTVKFKIFILAAVLALYSMTNCIEDASAHETHSGTGEIIGVCYGLSVQHKFLKVTAGARDEDGNLMCDHVREMFFYNVDEPENGHPAIHLLHKWKCNRWKSLCGTEQD